MIELLRTVAPYHDYGWFLALIAWSAAALIGRRTVRGLPGWAWLSWVAGAGVLTALLELIVFVWPLPDVGGVNGRWLEDVSLGVLAAVAVAGMARELSAHGGLRAFVVVAAFVAAGLRVSFPGSGAMALAVMGTMMALAHAATTGASREAC